VRPHQPLQLQLANQTHGHFPPRLLREKMYQAMLEWYIDTSFH
jgi:hypothetical protein